MASPFDGLPVELVDEIFKWLCPHCVKYGRANALLQLTRTCKRLNAAATPHLYHHPLTPRWWLLARTLIARPDLGLHVRSLLDSDELREYSFAGASATFPTEVLSHFADSALARATEEERNAITDTSLPWEDRLTWSHFSETLDMLVSLCPATREISAKVEAFNTPNLFIWSAPGSLLSLKHFGLSQVAFGSVPMSLNLLAQVATAAPNLVSVALPPGSTHSRARTTCSSLDRPAKDGIVMSVGARFVASVGYRIKSNDVRFGTPRTRACAISVLVTLAS